MLDVLIRNGRIVDGTGNPWFQGSVGIAGDRIVAVGAVEEISRLTIDADDLIVCPGFVDMHVHADLALLSDPGREAQIRQGVTVEVIGQDGLSYAPVDDQVLAAMRTQLASWNGIPPIDWGWRSVEDFLNTLDGSSETNAAYLLPHGTIRMLVMGMEDRPATPAEMSRMCELVETGMRQGAVGLSAGLTYAPGMFASDSELVRLCSVVAREGGYFAPHHRNYGSRALEAYRECIDIARASGVPLQLTHAHLGYRANRGRAAELLALVDGARSEGNDVSLDTYPYTAAATGLATILPRWAQEGGEGSTLERLTDPVACRRLQFELEVGGSDGYMGEPVDWREVLVGSVVNEQHAWTCGKSILEIAQEGGKTPFQAYCGLLLADNLGTGAVLYIGNEENVQTIMRHSAHMACSDGMYVGTHPHPRGFGSMARYLGHYVRDLGVLTLEEAIRHMTSSPARRLGFLDRGLIRAGMAADVVCFDPATVIDTATYEQPRSFAEGFHCVIVNGAVVLDQGELRPRIAGRVLRHQSRRGQHAMQSH